MNPLLPLSRFRCRTWLVLTFGIILTPSLLAQPVVVQDWPTLKNTRSFFDKHVPEACVLFDRVMKEEGQAAYRAALKEAKADMLDYKDVLEIEGQAAADMFLQELRLGYQIDGQLVKFVAAGDDKAAQAAIKKELLVLSAKEQKLHLESLRLERSSLEDMVKEVDAEIAAVEAAGESNIHATVEELLESLKYSGPEVVKLLPKNWSVDFDQALEESRKTKKPVMAVFSAGWCPPCQYMIKDVFGETKVVAAMEGFIPVYIDVDRQRSLKKEFGIRSVPTFFVLNHKGLTKKKRSGSLEPDAFETWLRQK